MPKAPAASAAWFPAPRRGSGDDLLASLCRDLATWLEFGNAAILLVREEIDELEYVAVHGDRASLEWLGRHVPLPRVLDQLAEADAAGLVRYLPAERAAALGFVDGAVPRSRPEEWHGDDILLSVVEDGGRLCGLVLLDDPLDGRVPDELARRRLHDWTLDSVPMILAADRQGRLDHEVRLSRMSSEVLRLSMDSWAGPADLLEGCVEVVREALDGAVAWSHLVVEDSWRRVTDADVQVPRGVNRGLGRLLIPAAERLLAAGDVAVFARDRLRGPADVVDELHALVDPWLAEGGQPQLMLLPIGAGTELLGFAALAKRPEARQWTDLEIRAAIGAARDLGAVVRNAQYQRQREQMHDLKRTFVATLVHELKNPVTAIKGHTDLVEPLVAGHEHGERSVRALRRAGEQVERTVKDLLLFAQYDDSSVALSPEPLDLGEVVRGAVDRFVDEASAGGIALVADLPPELPTVRADRTAMDRLLDNLVGNAVKYTDAGGVVSVVLHADGGPDTDAHVALVVSDTGIGIPAEELDHLFREFFRSSDPRARNRPGTGLGLAVVHRIVQRHGGRIDVESAPGEGTTFSVELPLG